MTSFNIDCPDAATTEAFGVRLGKQLRGGEVVELVGDIGSGKTTLARGLARGLDSTDHVSSPTFVVSKVYRGRLTLHHLDLYRLSEPGLIAHQLAEIIKGDSNAVVVVEWAGVADGVLPEERIVIQFEITKNDARKLTITLPAKLKGMVL